MLHTKYISSGPNGFREDLKIVSQFRVTMLANAFSYNGVHLKTMIWLTLLAVSYMLKIVDIVKNTVMGHNYFSFCHDPFEIYEIRDCLNTHVCSIHLWPSEASKILKFSILQWLVH